MANNNILNIAIIFGGYSDEHDISTKSAITVSENIDLEKYNPYYIGITKDGVWKLLNKVEFGWEEQNTKSVSISLDRNNKGLIVLDENTYELIKIDVIFPVLHGIMGEDGAIQGVFEYSGIPYIGCDVYSSAVCMDKSLTNTLAYKSGINTPEFQITDSNNKLDENSFTYPVFVKPARGGSSMGVVKVSEPEKLQSAIDFALKYDSKVLIEQGIVGQEVGCAVIGNNGKLSTGEIDQIVVEGDGFFHIHLDSNPDQKGADNAKINVPANLPDSERKRIQNEAKRIYTALGCCGLARVDMFLQNDGKIVLNEVNTLPGFTSYSRYPNMMKAVDLTIPQIIDKLVDLAFERNSNK